MTLRINGTEIRRVGVVDDSKDTRDTISDDLRDADFVPYPFPGPFQSTDALLHSVINNADALVCDHHLAPRNYAPCTGAEVVARCYGSNFPSVLVTRYGQADIDEIRRFRRSIPVMLSSDESDPDLITKGFEACINEFKGVFTPDRKPWRTLFRIDRVGAHAYSHIVYAVLSGWESDDVVRITSDMFPESIRAHVVSGKRFWAKVNLGAERQEDLYFDEIEYRGR